MELRALKSFYRIAQLGSFSKAAIEMGYTQAALTIQIKQLETELQTRLFDRFHKTITLTEDGQLFLQYTMDILRSCEEAGMAMRSDTRPTGILRVGMIESLCSSIFPPIWKDFHEQYPLVNVSIETASPEHLLDQLNHNTLDIVYFVDKIIHHPNWVKVIEEPEDIVFVTYPNHPIASQQDITLDTILTYDLILTEKKASYRYELEQHLASTGKEVRPYIEIANTGFITRLLLSQEGISFLPRFCVQRYIDNGLLVIIHPSDFQIQVWRQVVYHKSKWITPQMRAFIDMIQTK